MSPLDMRIKEIEDRCMTYYEEEQEKLYKERCEKRAAQNYRDRCSPSMLGNIRIFVRGIAEKIDSRGRRS